MNSDIYCQSCGMPITDSQLQGTRSDGSHTKEYCTYCYQKGSFVQDVTMDEMLEICVPHMVKAGMPEEQARTLLASTLPNLARWK